MRVRSLVMVIAGMTVVLAAMSAAAQGGRGGAAPGQGRSMMPPRAGPQQPEAPRGTATIRGVVLAADTGTPIRRAQVRAMAPSIRENRLATTDAQGRFEFKELAGARYTLTASKGGFVSLQYGQRRPSESGTPIEISDGQTLDKLVIALPRGSVVAGRIFDEFGEPVANAVVSAMRYGYSAGARRYLPAGGQNSRDTTDDLGQFRLFGLPPGDYIVSANYRGGGEVTDPAGDPTGYAPTYFPGTANINEAQRVRVDISQEQSNVNFSLIAAKLVTVSGTVIDSHGAAVTSGAVMMMSADSAGRALFMGTAGGRVDRTGAFRINNVPPGRYVLQTRTNLARGPAAIGDSEFARLDLSVGPQDIAGLSLVTAPGARLTGLVVTDSQQPSSLRPDQLQVIARSTQPEQAGFAGPGGNARVAEDWTFQISGLFDPALIRVNSMQGWTLKQVLLNGQDITDTPIEFTAGQTVGGVQVVLTDKVTSLAGVILDARGNVVTDATVIVFPADERLWMFQSRYIRAARPDQQGKYDIRGLPPYDEYLIVAVQGLEDGQAGDPEFLARIKKAAVKLSLNEGETKAADVKMP